MDTSNMYIQKWLHMVMIALILLGSINWLSIGTTGQDLVRLALAPRYAKWLYILIGVAALPLLIQRDIYLPFLGQTVMPAGALVAKTPQNANEQVTVRTRPGATVVFWASEPNPTQDKKLPTPKVAYGEYENSGVVVADSSGHAILRFRGPPQPYTVPVHGRLEPHVHFRISEDNAFFGRVQTMFIQSGRVEGFADLI